MSMTCLYEKDLKFVKSQNLHNEIEIVCIKRVVNLFEQVEEYEFFECFHLIDLQ